MHTYAIAEIAGRQFRIEEGMTVSVPRLEEEAGATVTLEKILLVNKDGKVSVGLPYVEGAKATATVVEHNRTKKVVVFRKRSRKGFVKRNTARQHLTVLQIEKVSA